MKINNNLEDALSESSVKQILQQLLIQTGANMKKQEDKPAMKGDKPTKNKDAYLFLTKVTVNFRHLEKSFAVPGHIHVNRGETITFRPVNTSAHYIFPQGDILFDEQERDFRNIIVEENGEGKKLTISDKAPRGSYPYAVITDNNDFAAGGSYPEIIVE